jgi:hypothetical protein
MIITYKNNEIEIINNNNINLKYINTRKNIKYNLYNIKLYYESSNFLNHNRIIRKKNLPIFWLNLNYDEKIKKGFQKIINDENIIFCNNIINIKNKLYLSINDAFINSYINYDIDDIIFNDYFNKILENRKNIIILKSKKYTSLINNNFLKFKNIIHKKVTYKILYLLYNNNNSKNIISTKKLPSLLYSNLNNLNNIKENIKFDIGIFNFSKLWKFNKNKKEIDYFNNFYKICTFSLKNIKKNGCLNISTFNCFHKNYLNYICYFSQYFKKIIIIDRNNIIKTTFFTNINIIAINYNGKKIKKFNSKYNYNDNNSLKIKETFINFIQNNVNQIINDYLNIKNTINMSLEQIFFNNINNIKLYLLKNNIKMNLLINEYFSKFDTDLLFDLNFFIKICVQNDILNIYYLEHTEYTEYLINIMKPQYEKDFKYIKYEKNKKIFKNSLLYLNTNEKYNFKILLKFDNIIIKKEYANFFEDFYIKDKNENYYFLNKNEFRITN